ncbi:MAG: DNA adenine methylase [bacterium]|nr:DNA adenine methylase [bacterium]
MQFYSPLRYPGGKNKLAKFVALICEKNNINGHYVEPYAGSASVALYLLINGYVKEITVNDLDCGVFAFWHSILNETKKFCRKVRTTEITVGNWKKFKKIHSNSKAKLFDLGFATFFLNRTNHSGIIDGGVIGGLDQKGEYKINCRFNKENLIERVKLIASYKKNIHLYNLDALELVKKIQAERSGKNTIFYFDPPYYLKAESLYFNHYEPNDHKKVSEEIKKIKNARWIVSYDDVSGIKNLYRGFRKIEYSLSYTARNNRVGREVLFLGENLIMPNIKDPINLK